MRAFLIVAALPLAGCTESDWAHAMTYADVGDDGTTYDAHAGGGTSEPRSAPLGRYVMRPCEDSARERAGEAADQGFDEDLQREVYDKVYAECNAFRRKAQ